jgi:hypothetical protein
LPGAASRVVPVWTVATSSLPLDEEALADRDDSHSCELDFDVGQFLCSHSNKKKGKAMKALRIASAVLVFTLAIVGILLGVALSLTIIGAILGIPILIGSCGMVILGLKMLGLEAQSEAWRQRTTGRLAHSHQA